MNFENPSKSIHDFLDKNKNLYSFIKRVVFILTILTFIIYPFFIRLVFNYLEPQGESGDFNRGTFGDMYGALNSFLSGLGFLGLLVTIVLQIRQFKEEKDFQREETQKKNNQDARNILEYIKNAGGILMEENSEIILKIDEVLKIRSITSLNPTTDILYEKLCMYDLEKSYTSYKIIHPEGENDTMFRVFQLFKNAFDFKRELSRMVTKAELDQLYLRKRVVILDLIRYLKTEVNIDELNYNMSIIYSQILKSLSDIINDDSNTDVEQVLNNINSSTFRKNPLINYSFHELSIINSDEKKLKEKYFKRLLEIKQGFENINESLATRLKL